MISVSRMLLFLFAAYNLTALLSAIKQLKQKNPYGHALKYVLNGSFVWGDVPVFSIFWLLVVSFIFVRQDILLFALIYSIFWATRSFGEMIYWLNQQFSEKDRNPPEKFAHYALFKSDAVWFINQIVHQCILVISLIASIYFAKMWLATL